MRQIDDDRAPFQNIDVALKVGKEHLDRVCQAERGSPVGMVAEDQEGGYFVRIAWCTTPRGRRGARKHLQHHSAEVGNLRKLERSAGA